MADILLEVSGLNAPIGSLCRAQVAEGEHATAAEVVGFRGGRSLMMLRDKKVENPWRKHGNIPL